ncbi:MAG: UvrD-helicase domain-containing protein [Spirochaetes bacterium]|jgi:DNA helicase-2/ATP-dependent DNA helicase PcrA|nr:UvrD-helicase domain-containing protein [Spirochaetota bacterium]
MTSNLNSNQQNAVKTTEGPLLILAGAGSGKTRVITCRIAHLIREKGVAPYSIFAVTFTNKAAAEMKERVAELIGPSGDQVFVKTFHSAAVYILRRWGNAINIPSSFSIYDSSDQESVIKELLKKRNVDPKKIKPSFIANQISGVKDKAELLEGTDISKILPDHAQFNFHELYDEYQAELRARNALDFNDLLIMTYRLLKDSPETLEHLQNKWRYFMVDEYQDTNRAQYLIAKLLAARSRNICVVGDDDQSIYSWRGADIRNILSFEDDYPEAVLITLNENYRSTSPILEAAHEVILNNSERKDKKLTSIRGDGELPVFCTVNNEYGEAEFVINTISTLKSQENFRNRDFAIFYRTNAQSRIFEDFLRRSNLPYRLVGGQKFYERKEIKDVMSYLRFTANTLDTVSLLRIINTPARGLGAKTIELLRNTAYLNRMSEWETIDKDIPLGKKQPKGILQFQKLMRKLLSLKEKIKERKAKLSDLAHCAIEDSGYLASLETNDTPENKMRIENIKEFVNSVYDYEQRAEIPSLEEFLQEVSLLTSEENPLADESLDPDNCITMMTVHNAKGLEFPVVFLTGLEEGIFPHWNSSETEEGVEEERRLAYVGITRAMDQIFLTAAQFRRSYSGELSYKESSRFLDEIPAHLLLTKEYTENGSAMYRQNSTKSFSSGKTDFSSYKKPASPSARSKIDNYRNNKLADQSLSTQSSSSAFSQRQRVRHPKFGEGTIIAITGSGDNVKLTINFSSVGLKSFLEKYTPLETV